MIERSKRRSARRRALAPTRAFAHLLDRLLGRRGRVDLRLHLLALIDPRLVQLRREMAWRRAILPLLAIRFPVVSRHGSAPSQPWNGCNRSAARLPLETAPGGYFARTSGVSTTCSDTNHACIS